MFHLSVLACGFWYIELGVCKLVPVASAVRAENCWRSVFDNIVSPPKGLEDLKMQMARSFSFDVKSITSICDQLLRSSLFPFFSFLCECFLVKHTGFFAVRVEQIMENTSNLCWDVFRHALSFSFIELLSSTFLLPFDIS